MPFFTVNTFTHILTANWRELLKCVCLGAHIGCTKIWIMNSVTSQWDSCCVWVHASHCESITCCSKQSRVSLIFPFMMSMTETLFLPNKTGVMTKRQTTFFTHPRTCFGACWVLHCSVVPLPKAAVVCKSHMQMLTFVWRKCPYSCADPGFCNLSRVQGTLSIEMASISLGDPKGLHHQ